MFKSKYFIVTIGHNTSSLTYVVGSEVIEYIEGDITSNKQEFDRVFALDKHASIIIILNNQEQQYERDKFAVASLAEADKMMKEKLKHEYDESVFKGAINLDSKNEYLFITINKNETIRAWLDYLVELPNRIKGVYSFALEAKALLDIVSMSIKSKWEILVIDNEYIIYCHNQFITKKNIINNLEEEIKTSLADAKYLHFEGLTIYIIANNTFHLNLTDSTFIFTPKELSLKLGIDNKFKSIESLVSYTSTIYKRQYKLYNPDISPLIFVDILNYFMNIILAGGVTLMVIIFMFLWQYMNEIKDKVNNINSLISAKEFAIQYTKDNVIEERMDEGE